MSNIFQQVLTNAGSVQERLLGPAYPYHRNIRTPTEIGMTDNGTIPQMARNIDGLIEYVELLVTGDSRASATGRPLGNRFFLQTAAKCAATDKCTNPNDSSTCEQVNRFIYVNNVPQGNIPFISSGLGVNFSQFRGLIPGTMSNLNVLNPFGIMRSFLSGSNPPCQEITMETIDVNNNRSSATHYVTLTDISNIDPCTFPNRRNPVNGNRCRETFKTGVAAYATPVLPEDPLAQLYFVGLAGVGIYILNGLMNKSK